MGAKICKLPCSCYNKEMEELYHEPEDESTMSETALKRETFKRETLDMSAANFCIVLFDYLYPVTQQI